MHNSHKVFKILSYKWIDCNPCDFDVMHCLLQLIDMSYTKKSKLFSGWKKTQKNN